MWHLLTVRGEMLHRVELRLDPEIPFTNAFTTVYRQIRRRSRPTRLYKEKIHLSRLGFRILLLLWCRFNASHKVVFLQTADMTIERMAALAASIFDCDPYNLRVARLDPAADISGVSLSWVWSHVRVIHKRSVDACGLPVEQGPERRGGTIYFGRGEDRFRIYDKLAERMAAYSLMKRRWGATSSPTFEEFSGIPADKLQLIRFERQFRIGRIPTQVATLGDLLQNAANFNPFSVVHVQPGGKLEPKTEDYPMHTYFQGRGFGQSVVDLSFARTWIVMNRRTGGNANRMMRKLSDFFPPDPPEFRPPDLFSAYQKSLSHQLNSEIPLAEQGHPPVDTTPDRGNE